MMWLISALLQKEKKKPLSWQLWLFTTKKREGTAIFFSDITKKKNTTGFNPNLSSPGNLCGSWNLHCISFPSWYTNFLWQYIFSLFAFLKEADFKIWKNNSTQFYENILFNSITLRLWANQGIENLIDWLCQVADWCKPKWI